MAAFSLLFFHATALNSVYLAALNEHAKKFAPRIEICDRSFDLLYPSEVICLLSFVN